VRQNLIKQRDGGAAVLLVSEELEELQMVADRIAVMFEGKVMGVLDVKDATTQRIGLMMTGVQGGDA
jgi:simple sugar transport system ATP-binding protein